MNKFFLFAVLVGTIMATDEKGAPSTHTSTDVNACFKNNIWTNMCAIGAPNKACDADDNKLTTKLEYDSVACATYRKSVENRKTEAERNKDDCNLLTKCVKDHDNRRLEAIYKTFCPTDKAKCTGGDKNPSCAAWAKAGECTKNADWMLANCVNSCCPLCTGTSLLKEGVCPSKGNQDLCTVNSGAAGVTCDAWAGDDAHAKDSECVKNPKYMIKYCMQSCCDECFLDKDKCPTTKKRCKNYYAEDDERPVVGWGKLNAETRKVRNDECAKWAKAGECAKNKKWMMEFCSKDCCTTCIPRAPGAAPVDAPGVAAAAAKAAADAAAAAAAAQAAAAAAAVRYAQPVYQAPVYQYPSAPATSFGSYGAFGGYGGALGAFPYRG